MPYGKGRIIDHRPQMPARLLGVLERPYRGHQPDADLWDLFMDERASTQDYSLGEFGEVID